MIQTQENSAAEIEIDTMDWPLTACQSGEEGEVTEIEGDCHMARRLRELGVETGARLRVIQQGSPVIIQAGESRLCLRAELAEAIKLRVEPAF
jgi:Fe2+ transport system protein FeoA